jgi:hypothetical protein
MLLKRHPLLYHNSSKPEVKRNMDARTELRNNVKSRVVERAKKDAAFKELLLSDPRKAVESELGQPIPSYVQFTVVQETSSNQCIVLPESPDQELSDEDLKSVSGGTDAFINMY